MADEKEIDAARTKVCSATLRKLVFFPTLRQTLGSFCHNNLGTLTKKLRYVFFTKHCFSDFACINCTKS